MAWHIRLTSYPPFSRRTFLIVLHHSQIYDPLCTLLWRQKIDDLYPASYFLVHSFYEICVIHGYPHVFGLIIVLERYEKILLRIVHFYRICKWPLVPWPRELTNCFLYHSGEKYLLEIWIDPIAVLYPHMEFNIPWCGHCTQQEVSHRKLISDLFRCQCVYYL